MLPALLEKSLKGLRSFSCKDPLKVHCAECKSKQLLHLQRLSFQLEGQDLQAVCKLCAKGLLEDFVKFGHLQQTP